MNFLRSLQLELQKTKRTKIVILFIVTAVFMVFMTGMNLNTTIPTYRDKVMENVYFHNVGMMAALKATYRDKVMENVYFQDSLAWNLFLPFLMIIVATMMKGVESKNNGFVKMLSLPYNPWMMNAAKLCVLIFYMAVASMVYLVIHNVGMMAALKAIKRGLSVPVVYDMKLVFMVFTLNIASVMVIWVISQLSSSPVLSAGISLFFVVPGVLVANTEAWIGYPFAYSIHGLIGELKYLHGRGGTGAESKDFLTCILASLITVILAYVVSSKLIGRNEIK
jgi:hypothetical protein